MAQPLSPHLYLSTYNTKGFSRPLLPTCMAGEVPIIHCDPSTCSTKRLPPKIMTGEVLKIHCHPTLILLPARFMAEREVTMAKILSPNL